MKESERLTAKAAEEENDIKAFGIMCKKLREVRSEKFIDGWLEPLKLRFEVSEPSSGKYTIVTQKYGTIDYFPKANKVLIRKRNSWKKPGLKWIVKNLLNTKI